VIRYYFEPVVHYRSNLLVKHFWVVQVVENLFSSVVRDRQSNEIVMFHLFSQSSQEAVRLVSLVLLH
jgi:hypothetical protein